MADLIAKLKEEILAIEGKAKARQVGEVAESGDGVLRIYGLPSAKYGELLKVSTSQGETAAMAFSLEEGVIGAIVLEEYKHIKAGDEVEPTGEVVKVGVSEAMIGRVVDALGQPIDEKGEIKVKEHRSVERIAPGVITREPVSEPLQTGLKAIDSIIPIGRGQRELIIGDRGTGKTAIAIDTIINQKNIDVKKRPVCIYVAIGQKKARVARLVATLEEAGAMDYTTVVCATASDPAAMNFIAPYAGCAIGEYFMDQGKDALIIYDDLSKQAWAYREIALLLRRPPGREAYPGDIFYLHSRLLERAAKLSKDYGGGSLTALPIIETQAGDVSAYIPTNVISITDGQIFLESDIFYKGIRPALNIGISVSRVGGAAQIKAMKKVAGKLKLDLAQFRELEAFTQFGSDLDEKTKGQIERGRRLTELMKQPQFEPMPVEEQVVLFLGATSGLLDTVAVDKVAEAQDKILAGARLRAKDTLKKIADEGDFSDKDEEKIKKIISEVAQSYGQSERDQKKD